MRLLITLLLLVLCTYSFSQNVRIIGNRYISLKPNEKAQICLNSNQSVNWWTNNKYFIISSTGIVSIDSIPKFGKKTATIYVKSTLDNSIDSCEVTCVNWTANASRLVINHIFLNYKILAKENDAILFSYKDSLYSTNDGFETNHFISKLPSSTKTILVTPLGYFLHNNSNIYYSKDKKNWISTKKVQYGALNQAFCYYYDKEKQITYVYYGEYSSSSPDDEHRVLRGIFHSDGSYEWKTVLTFSSRSSYITAPQKRPIAFHIHVVTVDPVTGYLWIGTGDDNHESMILYSNDYGETFNLLGMGTQDFRCLSIWFSEKYIYWNMDTAMPQSIYRIPRSAMNTKGLFPSMTPELKNGTTIPGIKYYVIKNSTPGIFPVAEGKYYVESQNRPLDTSNVVIPFDDKTYNYKQTIATLMCGSMWYTTKIKNSAGEEIIIMSVAGSANYFDKRNRIFGFKENVNGTVNVQELASFPSSKDEFAQLEPITQDNNQFTYFQSRSLKFLGTYQTSLIWNDEAKQNEISNCYCTEKNSKEKNYIIYPNPSNGRFSITNKVGFNPFKEYIFELFSLFNGEVLYRKYDYFYLPDSESLFQIFNLPKGVYGIRAIHEKRSDFVGTIIMF